jgi:hypothetical protein
VKIVQQGRIYLELDFHKILISTYKEIGVYYLCICLITSERNLSTLSYEIRLYVLSENCLAESKLLVY